MSRVPHMVCMHSMYVHWLTSRTTIPSAPHTKRCNNVLYNCIWNWQTKNNCFHRKTCNYSRNHRYLHAQRRCVHCVRTVCALREHAVHLKRMEIHQTPLSMIRKILPSGRGTPKQLVEDFFLQLLKTLLLPGDPPDPTRSILPG